MAANKPGNATKILIKGKPLTDWFGPPLVEKKCDCGAASTGVKPYEVGHSWWCDVFHEKAPPPLHDDEESGI